MRVAPSGATVSTRASSAVIATAMSDGCAAMQSSLTPSTAFIRLRPRERRAARPGHALVAGLGRVVEVGAPRALEQVAAGRGLVAKLRRRAGQDRLRQQRIAAADAHVGGKRAVGDPRADAQAALRGLFDAQRAAAR